MIDQRLPWARLISGVLLPVVVVALGGLALAAAAPPPARSARIPATEFSAARAMVHVRAIAQRPHPLGTAESARVRGYLVRASTAAGARVSVESGEAVRPDRGNPFPVGVVHNVIARMPGNDPARSGGRTLLLVAHYDSVPTGPGAADDGAAVGAMLESMRALGAGRGVDNDVTFLFTDGEEVGSLGATEYVRRHGAGALGAVLNMEARGSHGRVVMFETGAGNGRLIDAFAGAVRRPSATSVATDVYRRLPNDTDFTVFRGPGTAGMNSAFIDGFHEYHSPFDVPGRLSADTVQHQGEYALGMIRALGDADLRRLSGADAVYFDLFTRVLVHYPQSWAAVLALLTVIALAALLVVAVRRGRATVAGLLAVAATGLGAAVAGAVTTTAAWRLVTLLRPELAALPMSEPYERGGFLAAFAVLVVAVLLAGAAVLRRRRAAELLGGGLLLLAILLVVCVVALPGGSYLMQWPVLLGLPALWWAARDRPPGAVLPVLATLPVAFVAIVYAPLLDTLMVALGTPATGAAAAMASVAGVLVLPALARVRRPWPVAGALTAVAVAALGVSTARVGFDAHRPRPDALIYVRDLATAKNSWMSGDPGPDEWTRQVLGAHPRRVNAEAYYPQRGSRPMLAAPAADLDLPAPSVTKVSDRTVGDTRTVGIAVASRRAAWQLQIRLPRAPLRACTVAGQRMDARQLAVQGADGVVFDVWGADDGITLSCEVPAGTRLPVDVADYTIGLPPPVAVLAGPRPEGTVQVSYGFAPSDSSIVRRIVTL